MVWKYEMLVWFSQKSSTILDTICINIFSHILHTNIFPYFLDTLVS